MRLGQDEPLVSVVVVTQNEERTIVSCIETIRRGLAAAGGGEILVVDSRSADRTATLAQASGCRTLILRKASRICPSAARWIGASRTRSRYLLFMDGDCELEQGFLSAALEAMEGDPALAVVAGTRQDFYRIRKGIVEAGGEYYGRQRHPSQVQPGYGGCALYRRAALQTAGSFNPYLGAREEEDLLHRILAAGFRARVLPLPMIRHITVPRESLRRLLRSLSHGFYVGRGQAVRIFLRRGKTRAAFAGLSRAILAMTWIQFGAAGLLIWLAAGLRWPLALWAAVSMAGLVLFALRSRSLQRAGYYAAEWLIQGTCLVIGFLTPTPPPHEFRWEGEESDPLRPGVRPLPHVLLVGPAPGLPFRGGVEKGVDMLLRSRLAGRASMRLFNNYRRQDPTRRLHARLAYQAGMMRAFRKELAGHPFSLVHVKTSSGINFHQNALYVLAARLASLPVVLQLHCGKFPAFYGKSPALIRAWIRYVLSSADCVAVLSDAWVGKMRTIAPRARTRIIPNGLEDRELRLLADPGPRERPSVLFMGTGDAELNREKGLTDLLEVVPDLARQHPESRWVLAGLTEAERRLAQAAWAGSGVEGAAQAIRCLGPVDEAGRVSLLRSGSILVLPSYFENMPNIVLEAMAAGMAVVATEVGAVAEMLGHGEGGVLVKSGDRQALRQALDRLLGFPALIRRQGRRNRETVIRQYSLSVVEKTLEELYLEVAGWRVPEWASGESGVPGADEHASGTLGLASPPERG